VSTGHIVYVLGGTLMAVPFDLKRLQATGTPRPVEEGVRGVANIEGEADFAVSSTGFLLYSPGPVSQSNTVLRTLAWVSRDGKEEALSVPPNPYAYARLSPDGTRVALDVRDRDSDIWVWHLARQTLTRVTANPGIDFGPVWSVEGTKLIFGSTRNGTQNLAWQSADGTGSREWLAESGNLQFPTSSLPDGKHVLFYEYMNQTDIRMVSLDDRVTAPVLETPAREMNGEVSPDGRWLAYESRESDTPEIYVRPFPDVNRSRLQVSATGGTRPVWNRNGRELFFLAEAGQGHVRMMAVPVHTGAVFSAEHPTQLFEGQYFTGSAGRTYDLSADGQRFLMIKEQPAASDASDPSHFVIVLNWLDELKRLAK
jgi:serine/threonine-protein kinase